MLAVSDTGVGMDDADAGAHLRAVLHHQGDRQGHRARPVYRVRHRAAERRRPLRLQRARARHHVQGVSAARRRAARGTARRPRRATAAAPKRCSWSKTRPRCARSPGASCRRPAIPSSRPKAATRRWPCSRARGPVHLDAHRRGDAGHERARPGAARRRSAARGQGALRVRLHRRRHLPPRRPRRRQPLHQQAVRAGRAEAQESARFSTDGLRACACALVRARVRRRPARSS